jgi:hypothetical protein
VTPHAPARPLDARHPHRRPHRLDTLTTAATHVARHAITTIQAATRRATPTARAILTAIVAPMPVRPLVTHRHHHQHRTVVARMATLATALYEKDLASYYQHGEHLYEVVGRTLEPGRRISSVRLRSVRAPLDSGGSIDVPAAKLVGDYTPIKAEA